MVEFAGRILARIRWLREQAFFSLLDELIPGHPGLRALDVGCGAGQLVEALARAGYVAEGIDSIPRPLPLPGTALAHPSMWGTSRPPIYRRLPMISSCFPIRSSTCRGRMSPWRA